MRSFLAVAALVAVAFAGCVGSAPASAGTASIYVKDAPTDDFAEIHVVFTKVEVHAAQDEGDHEGDEVSPDGGSWITVWENSTAQDIDLLNATGDRAAFLGETELGAGNYTQIRVYATAAYGIDHDGERHDFALAPTPLKVVRSFQVESGMETRIILDYDLHRSIVQMGPNGYRMTPVIGKTITQIVEDQESGEEVAQEGEIQDGVA